MKLPVSNPVISGPLTSAPSVDTGPPPQPTPPPEPEARPDYSHLATAELVERMAALSVMESRLSAATAIHQEK